jgi:hypothetical protein
MGNLRGELESCGKFEFFSFKEEITIVEKYVAYRSG